MPTELLNKLRKEAVNPTRELKPVKPKNETIGYERRENTGSEYFDRFKVTATRW